MVSTIIKLRMIVLDNFARLSQLAQQGQISSMDYQMTRFEFEARHDLALDRAARRLGLAVSCQAIDPTRPRGCGPRSDIDILVRSFIVPVFSGRPEVVRQLICETNKRGDGR